MNSYLPPVFRSIPSFFRHPLALLGGVLLCVAPPMAQGQSLTFTGAEATLPFSGLNGPDGLAVDSLENVFLYDAGNLRVLKLPRTTTGYGPQTTLPFSGLSEENPSQPYGYVFDTSLSGVAVDGAGDVFVADTGNDQVLELPWTGTGYGTQFPMPGYAPYYGGGEGSPVYEPTGVAVDSAGNVFTTDLYNYSFLVFPREGTGYGYAVYLGGSSQGGVAVDSAGDAFFPDAGAPRPGGKLMEVQKTPTGYGPEITLPFMGYGFTLKGVAADGSGNLFIAVDDLVELPKTETGYGPQTTVLPRSGFSTLGGVAVDKIGNLFLNDGEGSVVEFQRSSPTFWGANVCAPGAATPAPCSQTLTLLYTVTERGRLETPKVLTGGLPGLDFTLADGTTCTGEVKEGKTCTVNVTFAPRAKGFRNGTVEITDSSGKVIATTQISGFGVEETTGAPVAQVSTTYLPFGTIRIGSTEVVPLIVANTGGGTLTVAPSISGDSSAAPSTSSYTIAGTTCGEGLTSGSSCTLAVQFAPTSIATHDDFLTVKTNAGNFTVDLAGKAIGLSVLGGVSGAPLHFGSVASGSTEVETLTITNAGLPGTVTVGTAITAGATAIHGRSYTILTTSQNTCLAGIAAGQSCTLPVEFAPTGSGVHDDLLTLTPSAGGGDTTVWLLGTTP